MKKILYKYLVFAVLLAFSLQSCVKDSYPGDDLGDNGTTFLKTPSGGFVVHWISPFTIKKKISLFDLFKDAPNKTELNSKQTVKLLINPSIIDKYNEENETDLEVLPANFYTWAAGSGVDIKGNDVNVNFGDGLIYGDFTIELDGSKWTDLAQKYALAFEIKDYGGIEPSAALSDTVIVQLGLKNKWDGIYKWKGSMSDIISPNFVNPVDKFIADGYGEYFPVEFHTVGETKVAMFDDGVFGDYIYPFYTGTGYSGYGAFAPVFEFDKETNKIINVTNYYGTPANTRAAQLDPSGENVYDPEKKIIKVKFFMLQPSVVGAPPHIRTSFNDEFTFVKSR